MDANEGLSQLMAAVTVTGVLHLLKDHPRDKLVCVAR
jgi:hypothetical protein